MSLRDAPGPFFGDFGGRFMPESLIAACRRHSAQVLCLTPPSTN